MSMGLEDLEDPFAEAGEGEEGRVEVDTLVERADLGTESFTLVAAGSVVPTHLAHLPRHPAHADAQPVESDDSKAAEPREAARASKPSSKTKPKPPEPAQAPEEEQTGAADTRAW